MLVIDIGGGSTEFCVGKGDTIIEARSMKLGAIRLTERFFADVTETDSDGSIAHKAVKECCKYVRSALAPVAHELGGHQPEVTVGSSGTAAATRDKSWATFGARTYGAWLDTSIRTRNTRSTQPSWQPNSSTAPQRCTAWVTTLGSSATVRRSCTTSDCSSATAVTTSTRSTWFETASS